MVQNRVSNDFTWVQSQQNPMDFWPKSPPASVTPNPNPNPNSSSKPKSPRFPRAQTSNGKLGSLTSSNFVQWTKDFRNQAGLYGSAGREITTRVRRDFTMPLRRKYHIETIINGRGRPVRRRRLWGANAERDYSALLKQLVDEKREHLKHSGNLWVDIHSAMSNTVLDQIKAADRTKYEQAQTEMDTLTLIEMAESVCMGLAKVRKSYFRNELDHCRQEGKTFSKFLADLELCFDNWVMCGEPLSDNDKACYLRDKVNVSWGPLACPNAFNKSYTDPLFPSYDELRADLTTYDTNMSTIVQNKSNSKNAPQEQNGNQGNSNQNKKRKNEDEDQGAVMSVKKLFEDFAQTFRKEFSYAANPVGTSGQEKSVKKDLSKVSRESDFCCWNCDGKGHPFWKCPEDKVNTWTKFE